MLTQFTLEDEKTKIFVRTSEAEESSGLEPVTGIDIGETVVAAKQKFEAALDSVVPVAKATIGRLQEVSADSIEVKFGINLHAEAGVVFTSLGGDASFEVTLTWEKKEPSS